MLGQLRRGDQIVTTGGLIGKSTKVVNMGSCFAEHLADLVRVLRTGAFSAAT